MKYLQLLEWYLTFTLCDEIRNLVHQGNLKINSIQRIPTTSIDYVFQLNSHREGIKFFNSWEHFN